MRMGVWGSQRKHALFGEGGLVAAFPGLLHVGVVPERAQRLEVVGREGLAVAHVDGVLDEGDVLLPAG